MIIYFAASYASIERMRKLRDRINSDQDEVNSRWLDGGEQGLHPEEIETERLQAIQGARMSMRDIENANLVAVFTDVPSTTGGLHFEMGYAMGRHKYIVLVGPMTTVFCAHPRILEDFATDDEFVNWVKYQ